MSGAMGIRRESQSDGSGAVLRNSLLIVIGKIGIAKHAKIFRERRISTVDRIYNRLLA